MIITFRRRLGFGARMAAILLVVSSCQTAYAGSLEDGIKLYNAKDYRGAKPHFETAARNSPMSWQAHFYLASSMMATGDLQGARNEFTTASKITTNPEIGRRCREGLERVNKMLAAGASSTGTTRSGGVGSGSAGTASNSSSNSAYSPAAAEAAKASGGAAKRREEIMAKARAECAAIRSQAAEQIKQEQASSNTQFRHSDGSVKYDISDDREAEINRDAEERCKRIMEIAEQTCKSYK